MKKILFCICTYNRNKSLIECLESIKFIKQIKKIRIEILILDNTKNFNSKNAIYKLKKSKFPKIHLKNQKKRGVVFARNACLNFIKKNNFDFIAFIDDDCILDKYWLVNSFKILKKYNADIVTGPQNYSKTDLSRKQINFTQFFEKTYSKNILKVKWAATNNVLFRFKIIKNIKIKFDEELNKFGMGEDQLFFLQLSNYGNKIFYSKDIKVTEKLHNHRLDINWLKNRSFRLGVLGNYIDKKIYGDIIGLIINYLKSLYYFLKFFFYLVLPIQKNYKIIIINYLFRAMGKFLGPFIFKKIDFLK